MTATKKVLHEPQRGRIILPGKVIVPGAFMTIHHDGWTEAIVTGKKLVTHVYEIFPEESDITVEPSIDDAISRSTESDRCDGTHTIDGNNNKPSINIPNALPRECPAAVGGNRTNFTRR